MPPYLGGCRLHYVDIYRHTDNWSNLGNAMTRECRSYKAFPLETNKYPFQGDNNFTNYLGGEIRNITRHLDLFTDGCG